MDKWAVVLRYVISYVLAPIAAKKGLDAIATGHLVDAVLAMVLAVMTALPLVYALFTRPSADAMKAAVAADVVLDGKGNTQAVATREGKPDLKISTLPDRTRGGQG